MEFLQNLEPFTDLSNQLFISIKMFFFFLNRSKTMLKTP